MGFFIYPINENEGSKMASRGGLYSNCNLRGYVWNNYVYSKGRTIFWGRTFVWNSIGGFALNTTFISSHGINNANINGSSTAL